MTDVTVLCAFIAPILRGDLEIASWLADWLDKHGDERGAPLRIRFQQWRSERSTEEARLAAYKASIAEPMLDAMQKIRDAGGTTTSYSRVYLSEAKLVELDLELKSYIRDRFLKL